MGEPHCYTPLQLCATRVALLDTAGSPDNGASNGYITDAVIKADFSPEIEEGDEFTLKNGCGNICATFKDNDRLKRVTIDLELCHLDAELISLLVGGTLIQSGGDTIGYMFPGVDDNPPPGVCFEAYQKAWDNSAQGTPPFLGGNTAGWIHWVFPKVKFQISDWTEENEFTVFTLTGFAEENPRITQNGPYDDWDPAVVAMGGITNMGGWFLDDTLPTAQCGFVSVTSAAS